MQSPNLLRSPKTIRVLIVDIDARVRDALRALMQCDPSIEVAGEASSVAMALQRDHELQPAVVLMELSQPADALAVITELTAHRGRRVVAMSMRGSLRDSALAAGACDFVESGDGADLLLSAIHRAVADA